MALDLSTISTGVDEFIKLIKDSKRIDINEAAARLGVSRQVLEEWALVLEEQGLIRIEYQLTKVYLIWIATTKEELETKKETLQDQRIVTVRKAESQLEEVLKLSKELDAMQKDFAKISEAFGIKMGGVKERIESLKEMKRYRDELRFKIKEMQDEAQAKLKQLEGEISARSADAERILKKEEEIGAKLKKLQPQIASLRSTRDELKNMIEEMEKEFDAGIKKAKKEMEDVSNELDACAKDDRQLEEDIKYFDAFLKKSKESLSTLTDELTTKSAAYEKMRSNSEAMATKLQQIQPQIASLRSTRDELKNIVKSMEKEFNSGLKKAKKEMEDVSKELDRCVKDGRQIEESMKYFDAFLKESKESLSTLTDELTTKSAEYEKMRLASEAELEKISLELEKEMREAEDLVKDFDTIIKRMDETEAHLNKLADERKELINTLENMIKGLKELETSKGMFSLDEIAKRVSEAKEKLVKIAEQSEKYAEEQKEVKSALKKIWELEGKGG